MAEEESQEKTEDATEKRKREAREKGQVNRSKELNTFLLMLGTTLLYYAFGGKVVNALKLVFTESFVLERALIFDANFLIPRALQLGELITFAIMPMLLLILAISVLAPSLVGGFNFSFEAVSFKLEKLDPLSGLKRMFSLKVVVELIKAVFKIVLLSGGFYVMLKMKLEEIFYLDQMNLEKASLIAADDILFVMLILSISLIFIVVIDVPYVIWDSARQLKMSKQEIKDEHKDTEGKPEVKSKIRQLQREAAKRRMMSEVPKADVVITNPDHFAVAIKYDDSMSAPIVVAKGADLIAEMIKKVALANDVMIVRIPPLARSVYYNVDLEEEIPQGLYVAVAKVLAYVYEIKASKGKRVMSKLPTENEIPEELRR